jgi:hypothetical protein
VNAAAWAGSNTGGHELQESSVFQVGPIRGLWAALSLAAASTAAQATDIALTLDVSDVASCKPDGGLNVDTAFIRSAAMQALSAKGYRVVPQPTGPVGLELLLQVSLCQNVRAAATLGYAASVGFFYRSNGTSAAADTKRVAFNYGSALVAFGGDAANDQGAKLRAELVRVMKAVVNAGG